MGIEPLGSSNVETILCNVHCRWDDERFLMLTIVELLPHRIIARFRGEDPLVPWLLARAEMTAADDSGRSFPQLYEVSGDRDLEDIVSVVFEGAPSPAARTLAFHVEGRREPLAVITLPPLASTTAQAAGVERG
ncbi:hypothetical protein E4J89_15585 [Arthrobacter sp. CAU 1506]|uniref:hypothetical protein n=1 Tax=Arthrobacter sp. CAU 1506 TaxID=2560052 RepID=UPI0010ABCA94|nr:hypothetical protein [Arthrobacter sp. CAU 1506]TJY67310.1 hypothetical protein E4J89_15585 [Arthrobacter sp. CAU 1506]